MIVFTNTSPLIALASIQRLDLLPRLFGTVRVTASVVEECRVGGTIMVPDLSAYAWLSIVSVAEELVEHPSLVDLDRGERDTIAAAHAANADRVIIDERLGRQAAEELGLSVVGSLGILAKAKTEGLVPSFRDAARGMLEAGIRFHPALIEKLAAHVGEPQTSSR